MGATPGRPDIQRPIPRTLVLSLALLVFGASSAHAFVFTLVRQPLPGESTAYDPADVCVCIGPPGPGQTVVYDVYLDTEGRSGIVLFSLGVAFDPTILADDPGSSAAEDYDPLYAPGVPVGKLVAPRTSLEPYFNPPALWAGSPPPSGDQVELSFAESNLAPTSATAENLWLGRVAFVAIGPGVARIEPNWTCGSGIFLADPPAEDPEIRGSGRPSLRARCSSWPVSARS